MNQTNCGSICGMFQMDDFEAENQLYNFEWLFDASDRKLMNAA